MVERSTIDEQNKWDLSDIFSSTEEMNRSIEEITSSLSEFEHFKGNLNKPDELKKCLNLKFKLQKEFGLVQLYASLKSDEDTRISENQALRGEFMRLAADYDAAISFIYPELVGIGDELINLSKVEGLEIYRHYFEDILRAKDHTLGEAEEELLAKMGELNSSASNIFGMINNADIVFEDALDSKGEKHKLTHSSISIHLESEDRVLRKNTFLNLMKPYVQNKNTIGQSYMENLKKDRILASIRNYKSSIEMKTSKDNIPLEVYTNLLETVDENLKPLHKLSGIRKKVLGVEELYNYDNNISLVKDFEKPVSYDDAVKTVLSSLEPLGEEYLKNAKEGFESRWVDVYENIGKRSGAYSFSVPGVHPYILMNYNDSVNDMFTLAHEMGHAIHSFLTHENQPQVYANYSIFLAEIASTVNEVLLYEYLMENAKDAKERAYLLNERIDNFRMTLFRQTSFAKFEKEAHELAAKGSLNREDLNNIFMRISKEEYGPIMNYGENMELGWSRIPHFYRSFYVYQYATGFCASIALVENIRKKGQPAVDAYLNMLKGGCSNYSIELLKEAGVDLTTKAPIEAAMKNFANLVDQLEKELEMI